VVNVSRREFMIDATRVGAGVTLGGAAARGVGAEERRPLPREGVAIAIPQPLQVVIDDVGWWSGEDGSARQEPYRTGIDRNHVPADYRAIVELGRALGVRPQAALVLCEWDKANILRALPESTWMGERWDNSRWVGPWQDEAADIIRTNRRHFECTIHGLGHELWTEGRFTRAEWATKDGRMRPPEMVERHLDAFAAIMDQHRLGELPRSFVPTAFCHAFGPSEGRDVSMAALLRRRGVTYINTPFRSMANATAVSHGVFGFDAGVMTVDRGEDLLNWNVIGQAPTGRLAGPTCGLHWPNLLHPDPERNLEVVAGWIELLRPYDSRFDRLLSPDSASFQHQLAHHVCTTATHRQESIELDFSETDALPGSIGGGELILKVASASPLEFTSETVRIAAQSSGHSEDGILYTLALERHPGRASAQVRFVAAR
jgi:hypothetical protein